MTSSEASETRSEHHYHQHQIGSFQDQDYHGKTEHLYHLQQYQHCFGANNKSNNNNEDYPENLHQMSSVHHFEGAGAEPSPPPPPPPPPPPLVSRHRRDAADSHSPPPPPQGAPAAPMLVSLRGKDHHHHHHHHHHHGHQEEGEGYVLMGQYAGNTVWELALEAALKSPFNSSDEGEANEPTEMYNNGARDCVNVSPTYRMSQQQQQQCSSNGGSNGGGATPGGQGHGGTVRERKRMMRYVSSASKFTSSTHVGSAGERSQKSRLSLCARKLVYKGIGDMCRNLIVPGKFHLLYCGVRPTIITTLTRQTNIVQRSLTALPKQL